MDAKTLGALPAGATPGVYFLDHEGRPRNPFDGYGYAIDPQEGVTKRELFAAMAMQGLLSNSEMGKQMRQKTDRVVGDTVARLAFECADALLTELAKEVP